uniref:7TM GPCR serpentine receptor class x (Srx) domain-containing protein n=1 Tax=Panagrolaimus davidi TaxID=227884 RepID=A0A914QB28_9BILA
MSFVVMIAQLLRISYNISWFIFPSNDEIGMFFNNIGPLFNDVFALSGSVSLLVLSSTTRKRYIQFYFGKPIRLSNSMIAQIDSKSRAITTRVTPVTVLPNA